MSAVEHPTKETVVNGISSLDEPSVGWGWHQHSRKVGQPVGWFFVFFLVMLTIGNHIGNVENYIAYTAAALVALLLLLSLRPKKDLTAKKNRVWELPSDHYSVVAHKNAGSVSGSHPREALAEAGSHTVH